jgi:two-component system, OmpR family, sensor histidine kinase MtrB
VSVGLGRNALGQHETRVSAQDSSARTEGSGASQEAAPGPNPFLEALSRAYSHDLRSPLGTIVNYATMLESEDTLRPDEVRSFARRIRSNAMRAADMLQTVAAATHIAARPAQAEATDLCALLKRSLGERTGETEVQVRGVDGKNVPVIEAAVVACAWSAYLALEQEVAGTAPRNIALEVDCHDGCLALHLGTGEGADVGVSAFDLPRFLRESGGNVRPETSLALRVAVELVRMRGGTVELWGRPGASSVLRICLPEPR